MPAFDHPAPGGWWLVYEPELHLAADVIVPDWAGWRRERVPKFPTGAFSTVAPDWVCEIVSPSTAALDRGKKLATYAREAVSYAWLIDPVPRTLEVLHLEFGRWSILATHIGDDVVRAEPFADIEIPLANLWPDE